MPRMARKNYDTCFYHLIVQGINKEYIFKRQEYIKTYLNLLSKYRDEYNIKIIAYCIMHNHAHILVKIRSISEMSRYMKTVNNRYAQYYNKNEQRVGYVFRDRFKSQPIYNEKYLIRCIDYIHRNPVKAKIVLREEDYPYSSYKKYKNKIEKYLNDGENDDNLFIEIEEERILPNDIIDRFLIKTRKTLEDVKKEKKMLNLLIIELKEKLQLSNREIAKVLGKDKNTINSIITKIQSKGTEQND